ncbi:MAG: heme ABC transporter permease CcmC [Caulobacterales bacterium]|nr:heme ABC transporter permease CcmC [Caulobacterales bacterium]
MRMSRAMLTLLANPHRFLKLAEPASVVLGGLALLFAAIGLYDGLVLAPPEAEQGDSARIMFVHVPAAWLSMLAYAVLAGASFTYLVWRHAVADIAAEAAAPLGAAFAFLTLATGSIWGRPTWGVWWVWAARLASMLVLFLMYLGYLALRAALDDERQAARAGAIFALVGLVNLPVIKFSVDWWSTLHQPAAVFRFDGPTLSGEFLRPLLVMALAAVLGFAALLLTGMRAEMYRRRADALARAAEPAA